jgi:putative ABC transport system ATP-binding protein
VLHLRQVSKHYRRSDGDRVALDKVSLEVDRGQIVGVFGPSGSGKTTLLEIAAGLCAPDSGTVTYNGERLAEMSTKERTRFRRREISFVSSADPWQAQLSVLDHVAIPLLVDHCRHRSAQRRVHEALLACEADQCAGMDLGELSDGERQRVEIARAIITEPRLLLADCPASHLSLVEQEGIMTLLSELAHQARVAVLVTDSDAEALLGAHPIHYLRDGQLVDPEPVSERGKLYHFPSRGSQRPAANA